MKYFSSYHTHNWPEGVSLHLNIQRILCFDKIEVETQRKGCGLSGTVELEQQQFLIMHQRHGLRITGFLLEVNVAAKSWKVRW